MIDENTNPTTITEAQQQEEETIDDGGVQGAKQLLLRTTWRTEAQQIPLDNLAPCQQKVVQKCIQMEPMTDEEIHQLEVVLHQYRDAIYEQRPIDTIETYHDNIEYIEDEHAFLELLDKDAEVQTLTMYYPLMDGREARLDLTVKPVTNAKAVMDVGENLDLFKDYTQDEIQTFNDYQAGKEQTPEERQLAEKIQMEIATVNADRIKDVAVEFLSLQTTFKGKDSSYDDMKTIYERMQVGYLLLLFARVKDMTHLDDVDTEKIFRQSD